MGRLLGNSRDARTHLKMIGSGVGGIELVVDGFLNKSSKDLIWSAVPVALLCCCFKIVG